MQHEVAEVHNARTYVTVALIGRLYTINIVSLRITKDEDFKLCC